MIFKATEKSAAQVQSQQQLPKLFGGCSNGGKCLQRAEL
jgi:hypothetical protein